MIATNKNFINNNVEDKKMELANGKLECQKCGSIVAKSSWSRHLKTKKHLGENLIVKTSSKHVAMRATTNTIRVTKITAVGLEEVRKFEREKKRKQRANIKAGIAPKSKRTPEERPENKHDALIDDFKDLQKEIVEIKDPKERLEVASVAREVFSEVAQGKKSMPQAKKVIHQKVKQIQVQRNDKIDLMKFIHSLDKTNLMNPSYAPTSTKTLLRYMEAIGRIYDRMPVNKKKKAFLDTLDFDWFEDGENTKKVIKFIEEENTKAQTAGSKRNTFNAFNSILARIDGHDTLQKVFNQMLIKWSRIVSKDRGKNILSDREKKNYMTWGAVTAYKNKDKSWTDEARLLYTLYTAMPPRRNKDYSHMKYIKGGTLADVKKLDPEFNYIFADDYYVPVAIVFNNYKTKKVYGQFIVHLDQKEEREFSKHFRFGEIKTAIQNWVKSAEKEEKKSISGELVFPNNKGTIYKQFTGWVNFLFRKTKKKVSANILRHSFITSYLKNNKEASDNTIKKYAKMMGNSTIMFRSYRRLDAPPDDDEDDEENDEDE
jgi:hypothetical protein